MPELPECCPTYQATMGQVIHPTRGRRTAGISRSGIGGDMGSMSGPQSADRPHWRSCPGVPSYLQLSLRVPRKTCYSPAASSEQASETSLRALQSTSTGPDSAGWAHRDSAPVSAWSPSPPALGSPELQLPLPPAADLAAFSLVIADTSQTPTWYSAFGFPSVSAEPR